MTKTEHLPAALRQSGRFCCWRYEERKGRRTKVPYAPKTGRRAQSTNPETFAPLDLAERALRRGGYDGLGVGIFDGLAAVDIDHCRLPDGKWSDLARDVCRIMDCYTEVSPSGEGLRLLFSVSPGFRYDKQRFYINRQDAGLEVYVAGATHKYVTVTGDALRRCDQLPARDSQLLQVLERYMVRPAARNAAPDPGRTVSDRSDEALLERARSARNGADFARLWAGDCSGYQSQSEADLALCNRLAFWTGRDLERMDQLFRRSGLMRDKWDRPQSGSTYGRITLENACRSCREVYTPRPTAQEAFSPRPADPAERRPSLVRASDIPYEPPRWLLAPYFQRGKGTLIQGDNGSGKTAFICAIAAHVSTGAPLLGLEVETPGDVILLSVEDDLPVLRGRIEANGGNLDRCHFMTNAAGLTFISEEVETALAQVRPRLLVFDPFQAFLGAKVDMFRPNETRPELAKLFEMCDRYDCACAIIAHMVKSAGDRSPVNRSLGSADIPASMRSILQLTRNPDDPEECVMVHVKCSNAPKGRSLSYRIGDRGGVIWTGFSDMTAEDLTVIQRRKEKGVPYDKEPLVQLFNQLVADKPGGGFWSYSDLKSTGQKLLGFPPFSGISDLRAKLDGPLGKELQQKDGLIVTCGHKSNGARGVRVEQYQVPEGYQTKLGTQ